MKKGIIWAIVIAAGLTILLVSSKTGQHTTPAVLSSPPRSEDRVSKPDISPERGDRTFAGDPCTYDCSGHEAGYNWAEENAIDDEAECDTAGDTSNSPSFAEGCRAYVSENESSDDSKDDPNN